MTTGYLDWVIGAVAIFGLVAPASATAESRPADFATDADAGRTAAMDCLAKAIAHEAGNEPEAGQEAVAEVILNRVAHRAFPKTVCGVVFQGSQRRTGCQFTFTCDGALRRAVSARVLSRAQRIASAALDGSLPGSVGAATHYHADYVAPRWAPSLVRIRKLGAHIFYRFPGQAGALDLASAATGTPAGAAPGRVTFRVWGLAAATLAPRDGRITTESP